MYTLLAIGREAVTLVLIVSGPPLVTALVLGLATGILQAATQVQEQTLGVVPRLAGVLAVLAATAPWIGARVARFAAACLELALNVSP